MMNINRNDPRLYKVLLAAGLLLLLLWLGLKGWRVAQAARSLQARQADVDTLLEGNVMQADPDAIEALVLGLRRDIVTIRDEAGFLVPLAPAFGWLPEVGPLLAEGPALMEMADAGSTAAAYALRGLKPALVIFQQEQGGELIPRLLPVLDEARPDLAAADAALQRVITARSEIEDVEALPWRIRTLLEQVDEKLYLAEMVPLLEVAPELLGHNGPRTYLLMAQNEDEIRPTGGFLTGAGLFTVNGGDIGAIQFMDGNLVDAWEGRVLTKPYNPAPEPLSQLMGLGLFLYRDANFWPDFPTSAENAVALYRYGRNAPPIDGVIALDQQFLSMLLAASGPPLAIPALEMTVSANNVIEQMRQAWEEPATVEEGKQWMYARKDFLGPLADAIKTRLLTDFEKIDPLYFAQTIHQAVTEKHLQLYIRNEAVATVLDRLDWDGRLESEENSDLLLPVDTNVGYNKVGPNIETAFTYEVNLADDGHGEASATLVYTHQAEGEPTCRQGEAADEFSRNPNYSALTRDCFWNYLRLYVPQGSTLLEGSDHPAPAAAFSFSDGWPGGTVVREDEPLEQTVFANFLLLPPGETITSTYHYRLPQVVDIQEETHTYRLSLPRQAGTKARTATVLVTLPEGAQLERAIPAPATRSGQTLTWEQVLQSDFELTLFYTQ